VGLGQLAQQMNARFDQMGEQFALLHSRLDVTDAKIDNGRLRSRNTLAMTDPDAPLRPLKKERQPAGAGAAMGALPPPNLFPATQQAAMQVRNSNLGRLVAGRQLHLLHCAKRELGAVCAVPSLGDSAH
jgi:hypothetical protein